MTLIIRRNGVSESSAPFLMLHCYSLAFIEHGLHLKPRLPRKIEGDSEHIYPLPKNSLFICSHK